MNVIGDKTEWISEEEAILFLGIDNLKDPRQSLRRKVSSGVWPIAYSQVTQKARRFYKKTDLERLGIRKYTGILFTLALKEYEASLNANKPE